MTGLLPGHQASSFSCRTARRQRRRQPPSSSSCRSSTCSACRKLSCQWYLARASRANPKDWREKRRPVGGKPAARRGGRPSPEQPSLPSEGPATRQAGRPAAGRGRGAQGQTPTGRRGEAASASARAVAEPASESPGDLNEELGETDPGPCPPPSLTPEGEWGLTLCISNGCPGAPAACGCGAHTLSITSETSHVLGELAGGRQCCGRLSCGRLRSARGALPAGTLMHSTRSAEGQRVRHRGHRALLDQALGISTAGASSSST